MFLSFEPRDGDWTELYSVLSSVCTGKRKMDPTKYPNDTGEGMAKLLNFASFHNFTVSTNSPHLYVTMCMEACENNKRLVTMF